MSARQPIEHRPVNHLQGGTAATSNPFRIEGFTVVFKRGPVNSRYEGGVYGLVGNAYLQHHEIKVASNRDLVAIQYSEPAALEALVAHMIASGLDMTRDGKFADFAIVHGRHGLPMPCAWLDYLRDGDAGNVCLKPEVDFLEFDWSDSGYEGPGWIAARGHGFIVSQKPDYDVWVDFTTGGTVVSLRGPASLSSEQPSEQTPT